MNAMHTEMEGHETKMTRRVFCGAAAFTTGLAAFSDAVQANELNTSAFEQRDAPGSTELKTTTLAKPQKTEYQKDVERTNWIAKKFALISVFAAGALLLAKIGETLEKRFGNSKNGETK